MWHPIAALDEIEPGRVHLTRLLGAAVSYSRDSDGEPVVWRTGPSLHHGTAVDTETVGDRLPVITRYCFVWTSLGDPPDGLFAIPEFDEPDRRTLASASIGVHTSAPRAVENFMDMGHLPFVHSGILGAEPYTEVVEYNAEITEDNELLATRCRIFQPVASAAATSGQITEYTFRVPHPYVALLYKTASTDPERMDAIAIFVQAMTEERIVAHNFLCMVDCPNTDSELKLFQQMIFGQDKPIIENQVPRQLPLAPRAETPVRADKSSILYRHWLSDLGITYGVIPEAA